MVTTARRPAFALVWYWILKRVWMSSAIGGGSLEVVWESCGGAGCGVAGQAVTFSHRTAAPMPRPMHMVVMP